MMRSTTLTLGLLVLAVAWLGPLPDLARYSFAAHMTMHMAVVAVAAPLLAFAICGTSFDPATVWPRLFPPIPASVIELVVVWAWHAPPAHHAARHDVAILVLEQISFIGAGLFLWIAAFGGRREQLRFRGGAGIIALLLTSMHMTLLGALFALANRALFVHAAAHQSVASAIADQHLGGAIMLLMGGASYLAGGLWLTHRVVRAPLNVRSSKLEPAS